MRIAFAVLLTTVVTTLATLTAGTFDTARADPYRWCAVLGNADAIGTSCYFLTLEQCQATVSGNGGFCTRFWPRPARSTETRAAHKPIPIAGARNTPAAARTATS
jgi:hypothetical protein